VSNNRLHFDDWEARCRFAGGRRRYNAERQVRRELRRGQVADMLLQLGWFRGVQTQIARELGVSRSVVSRDFAALLDERRVTVQELFGRLFNLSATNAAV
jgi:DNA-binding transcriptional regulator LsrR (DeoR family)